MPTATQTFARVTTDYADEVRPTSDAVKGLNLHLEDGYVAPATGNVLVPDYILPGDQSNSIGGFEDGVTGLAYELLYDSGGAHRFIQYDPNFGGTGGRRTLIEWSGLNLSINLCLQGGIVDGLFIYLGDDGYMRSINIARALAGYYTNTILTADPYCCHLVKVPPTVGPIAVRQTLTGPDPRLTLRIIQDKAYQFATRYRYLDGEVSVLSDWSDWLDIVESPDTTSRNAIGITLPTVPPGVTEVELLVRQADGLEWQIADTLRRVAGVMPTAYTFYGVVSGAGLTTAESGRLFESEWPAKAAVVAHGRVVKGNFEPEGYLTPEPVFTATVVNADAGNFIVQDVYQVHIQMADDTYIDRFFRLVSGSYPSTSSTYKQIYPNGSGDYYDPSPFTPTYTYAAAFTTPITDEKSPQNRTASTLTGQLTYVYGAVNQTLHESSTYRVAIQFYDAQGKAAGVSRERVVAVPAQSLTAPQLRSLAVTLTTTGVANLNNEIPVWAATYQVMVSKNGSVSEFRQGQAADILAYLGDKQSISTSTATVDGGIRTPVLVARSTRHQRLWIDIGNWPAAGMGYTYVPGSGDKVRFLDGVGEVYPVTGQFGDYVEVAWNGSPASNALPRIEIFTPNTTSGEVYYERGPRYRIVRDGSGNRSYQTASIALEGDCFLTPLRFPVIDTFSTGSEYKPPTIKTYIDRPESGVTVETMVPLYRMVSRVIVLNTTQAFQSDKDLLEPVFGGLSGVAQYLAGIGGAKGIERKTSNQFVADNTNIPASSRLWLDMSYGGRAGVQIPLALQQVTRDTLIRFSGVKQQGNLINGLSQWDALSQYGEIAQELGPIVRLAVADQTQSLGSILFVAQQRGEESLTLGQGQIQTADGQELLTISKQVIGGANALQGGYGTTDNRSLIAYAGKLFYYCRRRREVMRYTRAGVTPLGLTYKFRKRIEEIEATQFGNPVVGGYDPRRQEYWLTWLAGSGEDPPRTIVWSERHDAWADECSWFPEAFMPLGNELLTWQAGLLYRHALDAPVCTFGGVFTAAWVRSAIAQPGALQSKTFQALAIRSQAKWVPVLLTTPNGRASRIQPGWLSNIEGMFRGAIRRDENTPGTGSVAEKLNTGRTMQDVCLYVDLECPQDNPAPLVALQCEFLLNSGQQSNQ